MSNTDNKTYTGWKKWKPTNEEWATFSVEPYAPFDMKENEYLLVYYDDENGVERLSAQYCMEGGKLRKFGRSSISWSFSDFKIDENGEIKQNKQSKKISRTITPINDEQIAAFNLMNNDEIPLKVLCGSYGSGKTLLTCTKAVEMLITGKVEKIVWLRNMISVKNVGGLGYLPGTIQEKVFPWIQPIIDNLKSEAAVMHMIKNGQLEIAALEHIRGRCFENCAVVCSESQNLDEDLVKLIIGRIGKGSYLFFEGDFKQTDRLVFEKSPGMKTLIEDLAGEKLFGYVYMPVDERSPVARLAEKIGNKNK